LQSFGRFEQAWRFSLILIFVFVMTPNFVLQTVSATLTVVPIQHIRFLFGQLADNVLFILVQRIIETAMHLTP
jgi:hypothetical protein